VNLSFEFPPWMLWTAAGLTGCAVLGLVGGAYRTRRRQRHTAIPAIKFQPLPSAAATAPVVTAKPGRKSALIPPPAPLAAAAPADGPDLRLDFRRPGNPVVVLIADADQQRPPWNAWVVDRSRHGLRLAVERPLVVGTVYTVRPAQAPPTTPWTALEVRYCEGIDSHWEAGCQFLTPPPVTILMLFG
jgi:hypothetical protein